MMNGISNFVGTLIEEMQENPTPNASINEKMAPQVATVSMDQEFEFVPGRREPAGTDVFLQIPN